jgi:dipeptidyl aminopeptidase/acylaminoacyl peptidase
MRTLPPALLLLAVVALPGWPAAPPPAPPAPEFEKWTIDDVVHAASVNDVQVSPDARWAVWAQTAPNTEKNEHVGHLVRLDLGTRRATRLTRGPDACTHPRWSPDGKHLAFLSARHPRAAKHAKRARRRRAGRDDEDKADPAQLWLIDPTGGEPWQLTDVGRGVEQYEWAGKDALVFAAQEAPTRRETRLEDEKKDGTVVVEDDPHEPPVRLFRVGVKSKKVTRLTDNRDRVEYLSVSPEGRHAVAFHNASLRHTYDSKTRPTVYLHDLKTGEKRRLFADPKFNISHIRWAPKGGGFFATNEHSSRPHLDMASVTELYFHDVAANATSQIDLDWPRGLAGQAENEGAPGFVPTANGFLALLADGVRNRPARFTRSTGGWTRQWLSGSHAANLFGLAAGADGRTLLYAHSAASTPTRWYRARLDGTRIETPSPLPSFNEEFSERRLARTEVVRWKGGLDEEVEGILYYPHAYKAGKRYPLVVMIHGGPASADLDCWNESWDYAPNLLCQRGAFVLRPNYHGSSRYGLKWLESIAGGRYCEAELDDIERGVEALVARGLVDPDRLGLQGWSNGAILTNALVTRTARYKAAVAGAGTIEYISDWASCKFGEAFDRYYLGKSPFEDLRLYILKSPFYRLDRVTTPTLILFGAEDRVVHPQQGWLQYRGLQQLGKAPVRFVLFPGEKHSLAKISHQRRKLEEELAWFDRHLFKTAAARNEAIKDNSPLEWLLKRKPARKVGHLVGYMDKGILVPETVSYERLKVGKFEVTVAQYAEFASPRAGGSPVAVPRGNYPATGVTFEKAQAYCDWLSKKTGRRYRLPTLAEAEDLYDGEGQGENTLDAWAGYKVNPEDAVRLRAALKQMDGETLVKEVGRGRPAGKSGVFDLGGNVAEWVVARPGAGVLRGGSADMPVNAKGLKLEPAPEYRGFRVIEE